MTRIFYFSGRADELMHALHLRALKDVQDSLARITELVR